MKIYEEIWEARKKKIWSEELREKYKDVVLVPKPVEKERPVYMCKCKVCDTEFEAGSATAKYCSDECRDLSGIYEIKKQKMREYAARKRSEK